MVRLLGVILPDNARIVYALTLLYGVGWTNAKAILKQAGVEDKTRVNKVTEEQFKKITAIIDKGYTVEGDLREEVSGNVKRLKEIGSYRGTRHLRGLPAKGQRTKSNARTKKGKRKTVGALKKEAWEKLEQTKTQTAVTAATAAKS